MGPGMLINACFPACHRQEIFLFTVLLTHLVTQTKRPDTVFRALKVLSHLAQAALYRRQYYGWSMMEIKCRKAECFEQGQGVNRDKIRNQVRLQNSNPYIVCRHTSYEIMLNYYLSYYFFYMGNKTPEKQSGAWGSWPRNKSNCWQICWSKHHHQEASSKSSQVMVQIIHHNKSL